MIYKYVQYEVHQGYNTYIKEHLENFLRSIQEHEPDSRYEAFEVEEGKYIHFMSFKDEIAEELHKNADYTILFVEKLYPKCVYQPKFYDMKPINY